MPPSAEARSSATTPRKVPGYGVTVSLPPDWVGTAAPAEAARFGVKYLYRAPEVISRNMQEGRIGLRTGAGFLDYSGFDIDAYREKRLAALVDMLRHFGLARPPVL